MDTEATVHLRLSQGTNVDRNLYTVKGARIGVRALQSSKCFIIVSLVCSLSEHVVS